MIWGLRINTDNMKVNLKRIESERNFVELQKNPIIYFRGFTEKSFEGCV